MITFIRHAQSTFNAFGDKNKNVPITNFGAESSSKISGTYDLVICSTLKRARQTLDSSKLVYSNIIFSETCREIRDGNQINLYNGEDENMNNEREEQIVVRIEEFKSLLKSLSQKYKKIAVISHFNFLHRLTGHYFGNCEEFKLAL